MLNVDPETLVAVWNAGATIAMANGRKNSTLSVVEYTLFDTVGSNYTVNYRL